MSRLLFRPSLALLAVAFFCLLTAAALTAVSLAQPWLGLNLQTSGEGDAAFVQLAEAAPQALPPIPPNVHVLQLSAGNDSLTLQATDLIEEPDFFDTYPLMDDFFARQSLLARMLRAKAVTVAWQIGDEAPQSSLVRPQTRPLSSLAYRTGTSCWSDLRRC